MTFSFGNEHFNLKSLSNPGIFGIHAISPHKLTFKSSKLHFPVFFGIKRQILVIRNPRLDKAERGEEHETILSQTGARACKRYGQLPLHRRQERG